MLRYGALKSCLIKLLFILKLYILNWGGNIYKLLKSLKSAKTIPATKHVTKKCYTVKNSYNLKYGWKNDFPPIRVWWKKQKSKKAKKSPQKIRIKIKEDDK